LASAWANDGQREQLIERFWLELAPRERSSVMRAQEIWCVPIGVVRQTLAQLAEAGADAPRREARNILLNYSRRLGHAEPTHRRRWSQGAYAAARIAVAQSATRRAESRDSGGAGEGARARDGGATGRFPREPRTHRSRAR